MTNANKRKVEKIFDEGTVLSARFLVETLSSDQATTAQKIDCAKEILTRVYGKTMEGESDSTLKVVLDKKIKEVGS